MISANVLILISDIKYRNLKTYQHGVISSHSHQTEVFQKTTQPHRLLHPSMLLTARARNLNSSNKNELYGLYLISLRQFLPWGNSYLIYHYLSVTTSQPNDWKDVKWDYIMWLLRHIVTSDCQGINSLDLYCKPEQTWSLLSQHGLLLLPSSQVKLAYLP